MVDRSMHCLRGVIRMPTYVISTKRIPMTDVDGMKIVCHAWRETSSGTTSNNELDGPPCQRCKTNDEYILQSVHGHTINNAKKTAQETATATVIQHHDE